LVKVIGAEICCSRRICARCAQRKSAFMAGQMFLRYLKFYFLLSRV